MQATSTRQLEQALSRSCRMHHPDTCLMQDNELMNRVKACSLLVRSAQTASLTFLPDHPTGAGHSFRRIDRDRHKPRDCHCCVSHGPCHVTSEPSHFFSFLLLRPTNVSSPKPLHVAVRQARGRDGVDVKQTSLPPQNNQRCSDPWSSFCSTYVDLMRRLAVRGKHLLCCSSSSDALSGIYRGSGLTTTNFLVDLRKSLAGL